MANPNTQEAKKRTPHTDIQIILFIIILCSTCAFLLSVVASSLRAPQEAAKEFDQSKQMLISAKILNAADYFEILQDDGTITPATFDEKQKILVPIEKGEKPPKATDDQISTISELRIRPLLTDAKGDVYTLEEKNLSLPQYLADNQKTGYANLPLKLFYAILGNKPDLEKVSAADVAKDLTQVSAYVIPVSGFGLWGPIYGYLAIGQNGDEVIGTTWYDQGETPGLGANIADTPWQKQFFGKLVFQEAPSGETDFPTANMGIIVVKGKVQDVYGDRPQAKSAVDGVSGATLTGNGVTAAYHDSLTPYRAFLIKVHEVQNNQGAT